MGKIRPGNKQNAGLNGEWGAHVKKWYKKVTSGIRRTKDKEEIRKEMKGDYICEGCGEQVRPGEEEVHGFCD